MKPITKTATLIAAILLLGAAGLIARYEQFLNLLPLSVQAQLPLVDAHTPAPLPAASIGQVTQIEGTIAIPGEVVPTPSPTPSPSPTPTSAPDQPTATTEPPTATPTAVPPTETPVPLPVSHFIRGLENIPQQFNNCGPANMTIVLRFHGLDVAQESVAEYLKPNKNDRNVSAWQISDYVNEETALKSTVHSGGTLELLKRFISADLPVVIERGIDFQDGEGWYGHYLTLFGYDDEKQQVEAMNTYSIPWDADGEQYRYDELLTSWKDFNYVFYVIYPETRQSEVQGILGSTLLNEMDMWNNAIRIAQKEVGIDPKDKFAWFNLGTSFTELGRITGDQSYYQQGAEAFDEARELELPWRMLWYQHRPYMAYYKIGRFQDVIDLAKVTSETRGGQYVEETFLWLGHAYASTGNAGGARDAYTKALEVNKNFYPAQIALDYLNR